MFPRVGEETAYATGVSLRDTWAAMEEEVLAGKARHLGLCNTPPGMLHDLAASGPHAVWPPVVNQVESHPALPAEGTRRSCQRHGVQFEAYAPLGGSASGLLEDAAVARVAARRNVTPAQASIVV